ELAPGSGHRLCLWAARHAESGGWIGDGVGSQLPAVFGILYGVRHRRLPGGRRQGSPGKRFRLCAHLRRWADLCRLRGALGMSATPRLEVQLGPLKLKNPVITASGTFGYGTEFLPFVDLARTGGICVKGLSLAPRKGNAPPRTFETPAGMINAIGLANVGVEEFVRSKLPALRPYNTAIIANVFGETVEGDV